MKETIELIRLAHTGDKKAREQLVEENTGLIWNVVKRFIGRGQEREDLFQIGSIGLLKAIDKFDFSYEVRFSTYAVPMIAGEIKRFLRDDGMIKVSRSLKDQAMKARIEREQLNRKLGREPTVEELASQLEISVEELAMALDSGAEIESLHKTIYQGDGSEIHLMDRLESKKNESEEVIDRVVIEQMVENLKEKEKQLIVMRYYEDRTQMEIAKKLGISQVQVSRMEKKILKSMRGKLV
jgi:RNA polymerase sporulation-specific sigma factor